MTYCRAQEQYRKQQEKRQQQHSSDNSNSKQQQQQQKSSGSVAPESPPSSASRAERIQQLRAEHQRRHRERHGQYPLDHQEELYEQRLKAYEVRLDENVEHFI